MARYALVIGIDTNIAPLKSLSKTAGDARAIAEVLRRDGGFEVQELVGQVGRKDLEGAIERLLEQAEKQEALIYYTGHAVPLRKGFGKTEAFLVPSDGEVTVDSDSTVTQLHHGLSLNDLNEVLGAADFGNLVLLLDCCHSGYLLEQELLAQTFNSFSKKDYLVITACRSFEQAYANRSDRHSLFTGAILKGLGRDNADPKTQAVTGDRLFSFVYEQLKGTGQEAVRLSVGRPIELVRFQPEVAAAERVDKTNPYQGLLAFTKEKAKFFFGRDRVVQDLIGKLQSSNFVPLIGASGSGKSSVVRAGVVPRLEDLGWRVLEPIVPGVDPIENLRSAISDLNELTTQKTLLVIDQFEEIFTLSRDRTVQSAFIQELMALSQKITIVVTMRADFVEACLADEALTRSIQRDAIFLGAMTGAELEDAIVKPAEKQGVKLQERLLARILKDVESEENCLPLLEFALSQLWEMRSDAEAELSIANYEVLGGVMGALNTHAENIYKQLALRMQEQWVKRVMLRLVRTSERMRDTRQRQLRSSLLGMGKDSAEKDAIEVVINDLVNGRLLVSDRVNDQDLIDLSHEALMRSWKRFVDWREGDRGVRQLIDKVEDAKREWQTQKKWKYLLDGRLLKSSKWLLKDRSEDVTELRSFIQRSLWVRRSQMAGISIIPIVFVMGIVEPYQRSNIVYKNYDTIRLRQGGQEEKAAILNLTRGCPSAKKYPYLPFRQWLFGNCQSLEGRDLSNLDLRNTDLSGVTLRNTDLTNVQLTGVTLIGADLSHANLKGSKLQGVNFSETDLTYANLSESDLSDADLRRADLRHADLSITNLSNINMSDVDISHADLKYAKFSCKAISTTYRGAKTCPNMKDLKWDLHTSWDHVQGWENISNIPLLLKNKIGIKY